MSISFPKINSSRSENMCRINLMYANVSGNTILFLLTTPTRIPYVYSHTFMMFTQINKSTMGSSYSSQLI